MARYSGIIGYAIRKEDPDHPGVWIDEVEKKCVHGDTMRDNSRYPAAPSKINDDIAIDVIISIVADPFAMSNFMHIKYATYMGIKWKVIKAEVQYPRLLLTLGGEYHEQSK